MRSLVLIGTVIVVGIALLLVAARRLGDATLPDTPAPTRVVQQPDLTSTPRRDIIPPLPTVTAMPDNPQPAATMTHVVRQGENLYRVAQRYGITMTDILTSNRAIPSNGRIEEGQVLTIPISESLPDSALLEDRSAPPVAPLPVTSTPFMTAYDDRPLAVNSVPLSSVIVLPDEVKHRIRYLYQVGLASGNNPHAFSKIGDCNSEAPFYLARFDGGDYHLGNFAYLQPVIDYFQGSFAREGMAVWRGNHAWSVLTSTWADAEMCQPNESAMACEYRLHTPSFVIIRLGTNEYHSPFEFEEALRLIIEDTIARGIIPILGTKADLLEGEADTNNETVRRLAAEYQLPLWDFARLVRTLPDHGVDDDGYHMTIFYEHDYRLPEALQRGHGLHNLTALMMLDAVWRAVNTTD